MKNLRKFFTAIFLIAGLLSLSSCVKNKFDTPPVNIPCVDFESNTTIAELNAFYADSLNSGFGIINPDIIIKGKIVANDESGNIYKTLYLQDESGGIQIAIDQSDLYTLYRLGQRVYVKCKGLYLGNYGGVPQLGYLYNGGIGRIPPALLSAHFFHDSLPGSVPAPVILAIPEFNSSYYSMLVRIDGLHFDPVDAGKPLADSNATTNRKLYDDANNTFDLRTSNFANFRTHPVPSGSGSVVGILSNYNGSWQFYIRNITDLINFGSGGSPVLLTENFSTTGLGSFSQFSVMGNEIWEQYTNSGGTVKCAKISGFVGGTGYPNEDWLISPAIDFSQHINCILNFESAMKFDTLGHYPLKVYYSLNYTGAGNPNNADWTELTVPNLPATLDWTFAPSGDIDLSAINGTNVYIAFKYTCATTEVPTWEVDNIVIKGTHI